MNMVGHGAMVDHGAMFGLGVMVGLGAMVSLGAMVGLRTMVSHGARHICAWSPRSNALIDLNLRPSAFDSKGHKGPNP